MSEKKSLKPEVKYPKPSVERKEQNPASGKTDAEKYHKVVNSHPAETTAVTKRENRLEEISKSKEQLDKQSLLARIKNMVKKW